MMIIATILAYFSILLLLSKFASKRSNNEVFFRANRKSPWYLVSFGMIGASISGVTFVSVPGMVINQNMTYAQTCMGFIVGYVIVAFVLLPLCYKMNLITIYSYLKKRMGKRSYKTGASFFLISKMTGAAVRFYVVCMILQRFVFDALHIPFFVTVIVLVISIWLYTRKSGMKTLVFTDTFQTFCMFVALLLIMYKVIDALNMSVSETLKMIMADEYSKIFVFDDWVTKQNFWKQFFSGIFIVIVMTGLDQDMMQKNMTCKNLSEAQKNMCTYGLAFLPANLLFLGLGVLLMHYLVRMGQPIPENPDELMLIPVAGAMLGKWVVVLFTIGVVAACFSSADSALTALTTSYCVDIKEQAGNETLRKKSHIMIAIVFILFILLFRSINSTSLIDAIYILCSYTYGPLLGLFAYGMLTHENVNDKIVPYIAIASPILCFLLDNLFLRIWDYKFGYELLMLNGLITFIGLWITKPQKQGAKTILDCSKKRKDTQRNL